MGDSSTRTKIAIILGAIGLVFFFYLASNIFAAWIGAKGAIIGYPNKFDVFPIWAFYRIFYWSQFTEIINTYKTELILCWSIAIVGSVGSLAPGVYLLRKDGLKDSDLHGSAKFATDSDLKKADIIRSFPEGIIFGVQTNDAVLKMVGVNFIQTVKFGLILSKSVKDPQHVMMCAPTRSGKGISAVLPTLFNWGHSLLCYDIKKENYFKTSGFRRTFSRVICFEPCSYESAKWNPLWEVRKEMAVSDADIVAGTVTNPDGKELDHWLISAQALMKAMILFVLFNRPSEEQTLPGILRLLQVGIPKEECSFENSEEEKNFSGIKKLWEVMSQNTIDEEYKSVKEVVLQQGFKMLQTPDNERGSIISTAVSKLTLYQDPAISRAISSSDFKIEDLMYESVPMSTYLVVDPKDIDRMRPLLRLFLIFASNKLGGEGQFDEPLPGKKNKTYKCLFLLDEFPSLGKIEQIELGLGYWASYGVVVFIIFQTINQIWKIYGKESPMMSHFRYKVVLRADDVEDRKWVSDMVGTGTRVEKNISKSGKSASFLGPDSQSTSIQQTARPLLTPDEVGRLDNTRALLMISGMNPYLGKKIAWYSDSRFKAFNDDKKYPAFFTYNEQKNEVFGLIEPIWKTEANEKLKKKLVSKVSVTDADNSNSKDFELVTENENPEMIKKVTNLNKIKHFENLSDEDKRIYIMTRRAKIKQAQSKESCNNIFYDREIEDSEVLENEYNSDED